ncbi:MAG: hypothetical protein JNL58_04620 [Planctomyces sp.]|nr:hypothetical protein [Planctomyces sp.]
MLIRLICEECEHQIVSTQTAPRQLLTFNL